MFSFEKKKAGTVRKNQPFFYTKMKQRHLFLCWFVDNANNANNANVDTGLAHYPQEQKPSLSRTMKKNQQYLKYLQPSAFRRPSSLLPVCRLQKAFVSKMSLCKSRACIKAMLV